MFPDVSTLSLCVTDIVNGSLQLKNTRNAIANDTQYEIAKFLLSGRFADGPEAKRFLLFLLRTASLQCRSWPKIRAFQTWITANSTTFSCEKPLLLLNCEQKLIFQALKQRAEEKRS